MSKAVMFLSKGQAAAVCAIHGENAPKKANQRVQLGEAKLWNMPKAFRRPTGRVGAGKVFRLSADSEIALRPYLSTVGEHGKEAVVSYIEDDE
jgi:hypothetical protein